MRVSRELLLMIMVLVLLLTVSEQATDDSCEVTIQRNPMGKVYLYRPCNNTISECLQIKTGKYICEQRCTSYLYEAIGLGIALGLMFVVLGVVIIGWAFTCWFMHKTTELSIRPKESICLNQYEETPTESGTPFQPLTKYSRLGPSYENTSNDGQGRGEEGEGIYEVLDREEEKPKIKRGIGKNRGAVISGGNTDSYNTLTFEEH